MSQRVEIIFDCLPFRRVGHVGLPLDAQEEQRALWQRFRAAMEKHGADNTYFLYNADCTFRLTNADTGFLRFVFEATIKTDEKDGCLTDIDLASHLVETDFDDPLTLAVSEFFRNAVRRAVVSEFQLFIEAGNLKKALAEREQYLREWDKNRGFVGMDI